MGLEKILDLVTKALDKLQSLTAATIIKLFILVIGLGAAYTAWEHRAPAWKTIVADNKISVGQLPDPPSQATKDEVTTMVKNSEVIVAAQIVNVNFLTNERNVVFTWADDDRVNYELEGFYKRRTAATPFFLPKNAIGAVENNWRSVAIMNSQYSCDIFENTVGSRNFPMLIGRVASLCSVSIPPYEGFFSGYIVVWTGRDPNPGEAEDMERKVRSVARAIFEREFRR